MDVSFEELSKQIKNSNTKSCKISQKIVLDARPLLQAHERTFPCVVSRNRDEPLTWEGFVNSFCTSIGETTKDKLVHVFS